jgi:hypothetical protein
MKHYTTPAKASAAGELLRIEHPIGGNRPMAHVLMVADDGGIAWADHGWTDGLSGRLPFHFVLGPVRPRGEGIWHLTPTEEHLVKESRGEPIVIRLPKAGTREVGTPDGDRARARELLVAEAALRDIKIKSI